MADQRQIAALLREREGLKQRGLDDRVLQVDEQLKLLGHAPAADEESAKREVRKQPPQGRSTKPQQTGD